MPVLATRDQELVRAFRALFELTHDELARVTAGWSDAQIGARVGELVSVIKAHALLRIHCWILESDYQAIGKDKVFPEIDDPYFFCYYGLIRTLLAYRGNERLKPTFDLFFDEQGALGRRTKLWYDVFKAIVNPKHRRYLGAGPTFRDDKQFLPLQAADLYAFEFRRYERYKSTGLVVPTSRTMNALADLPGGGYQITERRLKVGVKAAELAKLSSILYPPYSHEDA